MSLAAVVSPYQPINGLTGLGLNDGAMYIGLDGQDPETNPQPCFWDAAGTIAAAQPIQILGGYPMRLGTPTRLYTAASYSIRVRDASGVQVFYEPHAVPGSGSSAGVFGSVASAAAAAIPSAVQSTGLIVLGYAAPGDGGQSLYRFATVQSAGTGKFQSADGAWWEVVGPSLDPRQFGAKFDATTDDRAAWQAAIDLAVARGVPVVVKGGGVSKVVATATQQFIYGNTITTGVYRALDINVSNLTIIGEGVTIRFVGSTGGDSVNYLFATAKNLNVGDLVNLRFSGLTLDFDPTGDASVNKRSFYFGGVEGVFLDDIYLTSTGSRAGATITFQQCRTVRVSNLRGKNITQGGNLSYVTDVVMSDHQFDNFSEAWDFDRVVDQAVLSNLTFRNGGPANQCLDFNSLTNAYVSGVTAYNVGNIFIINFKTTTLPTYAEYLAYPTWAASTAYTVGQTRQNAANKYVCTQAGTSASSGGPTTTGSGIVDGTAKWDYQAAIVLTPSRNVTVNGVKGDTIGNPTGGGQFCFNIYSEVSSALCENITVRNVELTNCRGEAVANLVKNLVLEEVYLSGCVTTVSTFAALTIGTNDINAVLQTGNCSATLRNVQVVAPSGPGSGMRISALARLSIDGARVERDGSSATTFFDFPNLDKNAGVYVLARTRCVNTGASASAGTTFWKFGETAALTQNYKIVWGAGHSLSGPSTAIPFGLNGSSAKRIEPNRRVSVGTLDVTTGKIHYIQVCMTDTEKAFVAYASLSVFLALAASGTDFVGWNTRSYLSGTDTAVSSGSDTAGLAAATRMDLGSNVSKPAAVLGAGDAYYVKLQATGAGRTLEGLTILGAVLDYATA